MANASSPPRPTAPPCGGRGRTRTSRRKRAGGHVYHPPSSTPAACSRAALSPAGAGRGAGRSWRRAAGGGPAPLLATGANDCALRLWDVEKEELVCTKAEHKARVNVLAWPSETTLFSADGRRGAAVELVGRDPPNLKPIATIEKRELEGVAINSIALHPSRRRPLLQTRRNQLLASTPACRQLPGHKVSEYAIGRYSPDGRYVVAARDGRLFCWAESGALLDGLHVGFSAPLLVAWSPTLHAVALCSYRANAPVLTGYAASQPHLSNPLEQHANAAPLPTGQPRPPPPTVSSPAAAAPTPQLPPSVVAASATPQAPTPSPASQSAARGGRRKRHGRMRARKDRGVGEAAAGTTTGGDLGRGAPSAPAAAPSPPLPTPQCAVAEMRPSRLGARRQLLRHALGKV